MAKFTKDAIIKSFIKLLEENTFDKITVKDIVDDCGINRNTFYYNFDDIYALVDEILKREVNEIVEKHNPYESCFDSLLYAANYALKNKKVIYHLHNSEKRQQVKKYFEAVLYPVIHELVIKKADGLGAREDDIRFISGFYCSALLGMIGEWLDEGMRGDFKEIIEKTSVLFDTNIENAINALSGRKK